MRIDTLQREKLILKAAQFGQRAALYGIALVGLSPGMAIGAASVGWWFSNKEANDNLRMAKNIRTPTEPRASMFHDGEGSITFVFEAPIAQEIPEDHYLHAVVQNVSEKFGMPKPKPLFMPTFTGTLGHEIFFSKEDFEEKKIEGGAEGVVGHELSHEEMKKSNAVSGQIQNITGIFMLSSYAGVIGRNLVNVFSGQMSKEQIFVASVGAVLTAAAVTKVSKYLNSVERRSTEIICDLNSVKVLERAQPLIDALVMTDYKTPSPDERYNKLNEKSGWLAKNFRKIAGVVMGQENVKNISLAWDKRHHPYPSMDTRIERIRQYAAEKNIT